MLWLVVKTYRHRQTVWADTQSQALELASEVAISGADLIENCESEEALPLPLPSCGSSPRLEGQEGWYRPSSDFQWSRGRVIGLSHEHDRPVVIIEDAVTQRWCTVFTHNVCFARQPPADDEETGGN